MKRTSNRMPRARFVGATFLASLVPPAMLVATDPPTSASMIGVYSVTVPITFLFTLFALLMFGIPVYIGLGRSGCRNLLTLAVAGLFGGLCTTALFSWLFSGMEWIMLGYLAASGALTAIVFGGVNGVRFIKFDRSRQIEVG